MVVVVGAFAPGDTVLDTDDVALQLDEATDVTVVETSNGTFVYAVGVADSGFSGFRLGSDGTLTNVVNAENSVAISLLSASLITSATIGGRTFLYTMGGTGTSFSERLSTFEVGPSGALTFLGSLGESWSTGPILGGGAEMTTFTAGGKTYLYVRGDAFGNLSGDMINVLELGADGTPVSTFTKLWSDNLAQDAVGVTIGNRTFLIEAVPAFFGQTGGIGSYEVLSNGTLLGSDGLGSATNPEIFFPSDFAAAVVGGTNYIVVANAITTVVNPIAIAVLKLDGDGVLSVASQYTGPVNDILLSATEVTSFTKDGETFVAAIAAGSNSLELFVLHLDASGSLALVSQQQLPAGIDLEDVSIRMVDGEVVLVATDAALDAVHTLVLGAGDDVLFGGTDNDSLLGLGGDDVLDGRLGNDTLDGGAGSDTASFAASTVSVSVTLNAAIPVLATIGAAGEHDTLVSIENVAGGSANDFLSGDAFANTVIGNLGNDTLNGDGGNDTIEGGGGADTLNGGDGDDTITDGGADGSANTVTGGADDDTLVNTALGSGGSWNGGTGIDLLDLSGNLTGGAIFLGNLIFGLAGTAFSNFESVIATEANDVIYGTSDANRIEGRGGDDIVHAGGGIDTLSGGNGIDTLDFTGVALPVVLTLNGAAPSNASLGGIGGMIVSGFENVIGGSGNDILKGDLGANVISGGDGADALDGGGGDDVLIGGAGNDAIRGGAGIDTVSYAAVTVVVSVTLNGIVPVTVIVGSAATEQDTLADVENIEGGSWDDFLWGDALANRITGNLGQDVLNGQGGRDVLLGGAGGDFIQGGDGADVLKGGADADTMEGGAGNDKYVVDTADDVVNETAGGGHDTVSSFVSYRLGAGQEIERLQTDNAAGLAAINLTGNAFNNALFGDAGRNILNGGAGNDVLSGGAGNDIFVFNTALAGNIDRVSDFSVVDDTIRLNDTVFTGMSMGVLSSAAFALNDAGQAADATDRIVYETDTGRLYFDSDGVGGLARVQFATLAVGLALTYADFVVF